MIAKQRRSVSSNTQDLIRTLIVNTLHICPEQSYHPLLCTLQLGSLRSLSALITHPRSIRRSSQVRIRSFVIDNLAKEAWRRDSLDSPLLPLRMALSWELRIIDSALFGGLGNIMQLGESRGLTRFWKGGELQRSRPTCCRPSDTDYREALLRLEAVSLSDVRAVFVASFDSCAMRNRMGLLVGRSRDTCSCWGCMGCQHYMCIGVGIAGYHVVHKLQIRHILNGRSPGSNLQT